MFKKCTTLKAKHARQQLGAAEKDYGFKWTCCKSFDDPPPPKNVFSSVRWCQTIPNEPSSTKVQEFLPKREGWSHKLTVLSFVSPHRRCGRVHSQNYHHLSTGGGGQSCFCSCLRVLIWPSVAKIVEKDPKFGVAVAEADPYHVFFFFPSEKQIN